MKTLHLDGVSEAGGRLQPGGYVCKILNVTDVPDKEYLKLEYDIVEGPHAGYYHQLWQSRQFWGGCFVKSYKESALPFFKAFLAAVKASNSQFPYNGSEFSNEQLLKNMLIGLVLAEEEYLANDGSLKTRLYAAEIRSIQAIREKKYNLPAIKKLSSGKGSQSFGSGSFSGFASAAPPLDDDLPF